MMKTIISNKIRIYDCSIELFWWCKDNLTVTNPDYATLMRIGKEETIIRKRVPETLSLYSEFNGGQDIEVPFGVLHAIWPFIKNDSYELRFNNNGDVIDKNLKITTPLYNYQEEAVLRMLSAKGGVLQASAGSGKTQIGIDLARRLGKNTLWLCGKTDLLNQTIARIHQLYPSIPVGKITDGEVKMVENGITVSTVQTLVNVDREIYAKKFDVVIVDECHACVSAPTKMKMFGKVVGNIAARYKYGLTATPSRSDTMIKAMYAILGCRQDGEFAPLHVIEKEKTNTLAAKYIKVELPTPFKYETLNEDGTFNYKELVDFLSAYEPRNKAIVDNVITALEKHKKQLVLCLRKEQCDTINKMLLERGIKSVLLIGGDLKKEINCDGAKKEIKIKGPTKSKRKKILQGLVDWNVIVGTVSLVKEGLDIPELSCLHWAMVIGDKVATIQSAGRIERVCEGKPEPEIYDYIDKNYPYCIGKGKKRVKFLEER